MDGEVGLADLAGHRTFDLEAAACKTPATSILLKKRFPRVRLQGLPRRSADSEFWT
jgi:hypothetical protein